VRRRADDAYPHLRIFQNVVDLITGNYVEKVDVDKVMGGAMHGLADSLDPDSAFLTPDLVKQIEANAPAAHRRRWDRSHASVLPPGDRDARWIACREGRHPTGDYIRVIGDTPTRDMAVFEGMRPPARRTWIEISITVIRGSTTDPHGNRAQREAFPPMT